MSTNETIEQRLDSILSAIDDTPLREDLFHRFFLENPIQVARLLHSLDISDDVKREILALRVSQKPAFHGENLEPLVSRAMAQLWERLTEERA
jgi:hypothetical protein